jgi:hypothetical protein
MSVHQERSALLHLFNDALDEDGISVAALRARLNFPIGKVTTRPQPKTS